MATSRILFLDDSGKPSPHDGTSVMVIGGFAIPSENVASFSRRLAGAKGRFFASRGVPGTWELKSRDMIRTKTLRRAKNRNFLGEMRRILAELDCTVYSASIDKSRMFHPMPIQTTTPLQIQALMEHFAVECRALGDIGLIVSDWSSHHLDAHASQCVATYAISRNLPIHPTLYFANSLSAHSIQVADLIAGIVRRHQEGARDLSDIATHLFRVRTLSSYRAETTHKGRPYRNQIRVF